MKILYAITSFILFFTVLITPVYAGANTYSIDLESGSKQYAYAADSADTSIIGDISIEAWFKIENDVGMMTLVDKYSESGGLQFAYRAYLRADDKLQIDICSNRVCANYTAIQSTSAITIDTDWHHVAITVDISVPTGVWYLDGDPIATTVAASAAKNMTDTSSPVWVGAHDNTVAGEAFWDGLIDEVRIWNDIRTAQEISDNYNTQITGGEAGLVAYWMLNNNAEDKGESTDPAGAIADDLTLVNSPVYSTTVPFVGETPAVKVKRSSQVIQFE